jgi:hypothetical protein
LAAYAISGCGHYGCYLEHLTGHYDLFAPLDMESMAIWRESLGRVPASVFAVGWDDQFILAKQHPRAGYPAPAERNVTHWYIIRVTNDEVFGPLTESEFAAKRAELGVPDSLAFARVFKELE